MDDEDSEEAGCSIKSSPPRAASKIEQSKFLLKCLHCDFRISTAALLESHARAKHLDQEWFRCKLCNFFAATSVWMEDHLISDSHMERQTGKKSAEVSSFEVYVECVSRESRGDADVKAKTGEGGESVGKVDQETEEGAEYAQAVSVEEDGLEFEPPRKKRGRPKQGTTTTCSYCGLVVSSATNLSVHVRRKHSKDYGYSCTLCNYSCVTKGDMDRHCITRKHVKRAQECASTKPVKNHTSVSPPGATSEVAQEIDADTHTSDKEKESDNIASKESSEEELTQPHTEQKISKTDYVNPCSRCDFVAQSVPALHLHVKQKHIKDFEYVCLACSYYTVTTREMLRHVNTEKHKQKSQKHLGQLENDGTRSTLKETNSKTESCVLSSSNEELESCSEEAAESQNEAVSSVTACDNSDINDTEGETQEETITSGPGVQTSPTASSDPQQPPSEPQSAANETTQQEDGEGGGKETDEEHLEDDGMIVDGKSNSPDTQMSKVFPFDACILSLKALTEQEQLVQQRLTLEGEAAVMCLTGSSPVPYDVLTSGFSYVKKLKNKEMKEEAKGSSSRIRCEDCGFMADGISGLNVHISMKHPCKEKHFHCLVCGKSFYTESNLHQHLTSAAHLRNEQNSVEELPEGGSTFKCVKCTERFDSEQDLFVHIKEKHEELLREVNKYVVEDTEQINREREENQGNVCKYCGKVCKSSNSMAFLAHIRTHTGRYL